MIVTTVVIVEKTCLFDCWFFSLVIVFHFALFFFVCFCLLYFHVILLTMGNVSDVMQMGCNHFILYKRIPLFLEIQSSGLGLQVNEARKKM